MSMHQAMDDYHDIKGYTLYAGGVATTYYMSQATLTRVSDALNMVLIGQYVE